MGHMHYIVFTHHVFICQRVDTTFLEPSIAVWTRPKALGVQTHGHTKKQIHTKPTVRFNYVFCCHCVFFLLHSLHPSLKELLLSSITAAATRHSSLPAAVEEKYCVDVGARENKSRGRKKGRRKKKTEIYTYVFDRLMEVHVRWKSSPNMATLVGHTFGSNVIYGYTVVKTVHRGR